MADRPTTVVNVRRGGDCDVYIGRRNRRFPKGSPWGNPYKVGRDGDRDEVLAQYEAHVRGEPALMKRLHELRGWKLGCWCVPERCHGHVLARLADGPEGLASALCRSISSERYTFSSEDELQESLLPVIRGAALSLGAGVERESIAGGDRFDFLVGRSVAVEVKIDGSLADLTRQVHRYAQREDIRAVVVVTTRSRLASLPPQMAGTPIFTVHLLGSCL